MSRCHYQMAYLETDFELLIAIIGLCMFVYLMWQHNGSVKRYKFPAGPPGWPIVGNVLELDVFNLHLSLRKLAHIYGDIVCVKMFYQKVVILNSIDIIKQVFVNDAVTSTAVAGRRDTFFGLYMYKDFQSVIFQSAGLQQIQMRKLFANALRMHGEGLQSKEKIIQEELREYVLRELTNQNGNVFDPDDVISPSLIDILCLTMLGKRLETDDPKYKTICDASVMFINLLAIDVELILATFPFVRYFNFTKQGRCYQEAIRTKREILKLAVGDQKASYSPHVCRGMMDVFISAMMNQQEGANPQWTTDATLEGFAIDAFVNGTHTTRCTLLSCILALVNFPHVASRIQREIDDVIDTGNLPCLHDREHMPYLNAVILELFRTAPVAPIPFPRIATQDITFGNYSVPKGTVFMANVWNVHHDESIFPNPKEFLPERFLDDSGKLLPVKHKRRRSVIPFSLGRRSCPGEKLATSITFLYIATILQRFNLSRDESCPLYEPDKFLPSFFIRPKQFKIKATPR